MVKLNYTAEHFLKKRNAIVPNERGCLIWPGTPSREKKQIEIAGRRVYAPRLFLELKLGRLLKDGHYALHHCDCPSCVNPEHLYEGTQKENMRDRGQRNVEWRKNVVKRVKSDPEYRAKTLVNFNRGREIAHKKASAYYYAQCGNETCDWDRSKKNVWPDDGCSSFYGGY